MDFFRWLYRLPGRIERNMEKTAVAASVEPGGNPGPQSNLVGVQLGLGFMEGNEEPEGSADSENR